VSDRLADALAELVEALRAEMAAGDRSAGSDAPDRLYSVEDAAELLAVGRTFLYGEIQAGRIRSLKAGRRRLVPSAAIREYAERPA
jgi:excisionase family DNA binding protein